MRNSNWKIKYHCWWLLLLPAVVSCASKKSRLVNFMADTENGLMQVKNTGHQTIAMQVLPSTASLQKSNSGTNFYKVKLVLSSNEKIKGPAAMQYMNFGIKNSFYAVQGIDTLPCVICERIPGINDKEYIYMTLFNKPAAADTQGTILRLCIADTTAGFGTTIFYIKNDALQKMEAIEQ